MQPTLFVKFFGYGANTLTTVFYVQENLELKMSEINLKKTHLI